MLLFALSAILGVLPAYDASLSVSALVAILGSIGLYFAIAYGSRSPVVIRAVAILGLLVAVTFALYFITQYGHLGYEKGNIIARLGEFTTLLPDLGGFTPQPNAAATFLEVAAPLGIALAVSSRKPASKVVLAIGTLSVVYAIFLTASRGSWLALGVTASLAIALSVLARLPRRTARMIVGAGIAIAFFGLIAVVALGPDRLPFLSSTFSRASDRGRLFLNSLYLAGDYAFSGAGLGDTFALVYSRYSLLIQVPFLTYAHNLPLSVWLNQGLLGLIAFGGLALTFYAFVFRVNRAAQPSALFHGAWLGVTATLLHGLTDAPQYADSRWVMPMLFVWIGLAVASGRWARRESPAATDSRSRFYQPGRELPEDKSSGYSTAPDESGSQPRLRGAAPKPGDLSPGGRRSFPSNPEEARFPITRRALLAILVVLALTVIIFNRSILAAWQTNLGAIAETRGELAPSLDPSQRDELYASAEAAYRNALGIDPAQPNANRRLGNLLVKLDRFDEAAPPLEVAAERETTNPAAIKGLGLAYVWVGRTADAARAFLRLDDPAEMASELYTWGNYRREQAQPLLAAYALEAAQAMYPDSARLDVWLLIADAYRAAGQVDAARAWYNRVLAAEPDNARARAALAEIEQ
jgi:O-antigen ligase